MSDTREDAIVGILRLLAGGFRLVVDDDGSPWVFGLYDRRSGRMRLRSIEIGPGVYHELLQRRLLKRHCHPFAGQHWHTVSDTGRVILAGHGK